MDFTISKSLCQNQDESHLVPDHIMDLPGNAGKEIQIDGFITQEMTVNEEGMVVLLFI